jgi:LuxR family maltose regulon positive regulatory protein
VDQAKLLVARRLPQEAIRVIERCHGRKQVASLLALQRAAIEVGESSPALPPPLPAQRRTVPLEALVDGWLVQAAHAIKVGDPGRGRLCLERALRLAAPERLRRPFFEAPPAVRGLLRPSGDLVARHPWLRVPGPTRGGDHAAAGSGEQSPEARRDGAARPIPLTSKEQEVLEYLAELLTTDEIAKTMFVSVNTVRSHVRSILRKLGASRRNEAVRRAWELGVLPSRPAA